MDNWNVERGSVYWTYWKYFADTCFVAEEDSNIVGVLIGFRSQVNEKQSYLWTLAVAKEFQGKGIGTQLMEEFEKAVKKKGCEEIQLQTYLDNEKALAFYHRRGFGHEKHIHKLGNVRRELRKYLRE